jgi:hypothetical protein
VHPRLPSRVPQSRGAQAPTRKPPAAPPRVPVLRPPHPPRSPLRASLRGASKLRRGRSDPVALTSWLGSSSSRDGPPAAVPAGPEAQPGAG